MAFMKLFQQKINGKKTTVIPITSTRAVIDEDGFNLSDTVIQADTENIVETDDTIRVNATRLGGKSRAYFESIPGSYLNTFEDYESGTTVPDENVSLANISTERSTPVLFQYVKAFLKKTITVGRLANNCTVTQPGVSALDAAQGKYLKDLMSPSSLLSKITTTYTIQSSLTQFMCVNKLVIFNMKISNTAGHIPSGTQIATLTAGFPSSSVTYVSFPCLLTVYATDVYSGMGTIRVYSNGRIVLVHNLVSGAESIAVSASWITD